MKVKVYYKKIRIKIIIHLKNNTQEIIKGKIKYNILKLKTTLLKALFPVEDNYFTLN